LGARQRPDALAWIETGAKQHLVGQEVPDAGDGTLIEQSCLQCRALALADREDFLELHGG
jgi:hypothetical protein